MPASSHIAFACGTRGGNFVHEAKETHGVIVPLSPAALTPERQAAIYHAIEVMAQGLRWGAALRSFTRDEMHER